jgi:hypothetical protein
MGLAVLTDALAGYLGSTLHPSPALVGATYPSVKGDLPAVVISCSGVLQQLRGIGRLPAERESGALSASTTVDLANPIATFPDAIVTLLSSDRRTLTLPHGPLVAADGTTTTFSGADLHVTLGATTFTVVDTSPGAGQVQPDPELGVLHFGAALPGTGTLKVSYFVGVWEVRTERYQGELLLELFAIDAAGVDSLSRAVEQALLAPTGAPPHGFNRIAPTAWAAMEEAGKGRGGARSRALGFTFDYDLVEPNLAASGGLIGTVSVSSTFGAEHFDVQHEGSTP